MDIAESGGGRKINLEMEAESSRQRCSSGSAGSGDLEDQLLREQCMFEELKPAQELSEYPEDTKFRLVTYYLDKLNSFNLLPLRDSEEHEFRMNEEIWDIAEDSEFILGRVPLVKEVVLAPSFLGKQNEYHRAVVLKIVDDVQVKVYFVDLGGFAIVDVERLKPINAAIKQYPILGHHVILKKMKKSSDLILTSQFQTLMEKLSKMEFTVENVAKCLKSDKHHKIVDLIPQRSAEIFYENRGKTYSLLEDIKKLEVWEWERFSNLRGDDKDLCTNGGFSWTSGCSAPDLFLNSFDLEVGSTFTAFVSSVTGEFSEKAKDQGKRDCLLAKVQIVHLDDPVHQNAFNVLHHQMDRYARHVKPCTFVPTVQEPLMFKLNNQNDDRIKRPGQWLRGVRMDEMVYLIDLDDFVPFMKLPPEDTEIRELYGEFLQIPVLAVEIHPIENGERLTLMEAQEKLESSRQYTFKITKSFEDGSYEALFGPVVTAVTTEKNAHEDE